MASLAFLAVLFFFIPIVMAFVALSEIHHLRDTLRNFPLNELTSRVYRLEQKLAALQKNLDAASTAISTAAQAIPHPAERAGDASQTPPPVPRPVTPSPVSAAPHPASAAVAAPPHPSVHILHPPPARIPDQPSSADLEALIGGRWFNRIGIIALLFSVSYFLKLAFDNNWIGPAGRVSIGILLGLLMLPWSNWLLSRNYTYFSEGIAGLGEATLFVSVWAGCQYYTLFSRQVGFIVLVVVTAIMAFLALRRNSQRIAFLSLLGGLLAPALMSTGQNHQVILFCYLLLLGAAAGAIAGRRGWQSLLPLSFVATHLYFWEWYDTFYRRSGFLGSTLLFATLIFALYAILPAALALNQREFRVPDVLLVLANPTAYVVILYSLFWPADRWPLTLLFIALAIGHEAIALLLPNPDAPEAATPRALYTALTVACFTLAIPAKLDHNAITLALAVEGAALVWAGFRTLGNLLRPLGYLLLAIAAFHMFLDLPSGGAFLFNPRFGTYLVLVAALAVCLWSAISARSSTSAAHSGSAEVALLSIAINFFSLLALSQEFWDYFGGPRHYTTNSLAQHLSLSILWTAYAALLLLLGAQRQWPLLRWQALVLLGFVVFKVFFYDLSFLDRAYRIFSFFVLGAVLLAVSFFYQRKLARERSSP